jgi:hypothetical protein
MSSARTWGWAKARAGGGGGGWFKVLEVGTDGVGEQVTGASIELAFTMAREILTFSSGKSFLYRCARPTDFFPFPLPLFSRPLRDILGAASPFLIAFRRKSFRSHGPSRLSFLLGTCELLGRWAEGRRRVAHFLGLSEPPSRATHVNIYSFF